MRVLQVPRGCFQLLGFDVLLDQQGHVSLLGTWFTCFTSAKVQKLTQKALPEINRNPDLQPHTRTLYRLLPRIVEETLEVATEVNLRINRGNTVLWPLDSGTGYSLLFTQPE